jgi:hypothetical protein
MPSTLLQIPTEPIDRFPRRRESIEAAQASDSDVSDLAGLCDEAANDPTFARIRACDFGTQPASNVISSS